ncbi:MAG: hypothetical protein WCA46_26220 [Actinocatenispora sp.]
MPTLLFPDNTVLINFAIVRRIDLLERLANGRGRWCATVASECAQSARQPGLEELDAAPDIFGSPWYPETGAEYLDTQALRLELAQPGDRPHQHLGEAETLAIMLRRSVDGFFVTDDRSAARLARKNAITVVSTWDLLRVAARAALVDRATLWGYLQTLRSAGRGNPRGVTDRPTYNKWLG